MDLLRTFTDEEGPPPEPIRMMNAAGQYLSWDGKRYYWESEGTHLMVRDCWPPDGDTGPYFEVSGPTLAQTERLVKNAVIRELKFLHDDVLWMCKSQKEAIDAIKDRIKVMEDHLK